MQNKTKKIKLKASDMFFLAFISYLPLWVELFFNGLIEDYFYFLIPLGDLGWTLVLRAICVTIWLLSAIGIRKTAIKNCDFDIIEKVEKPTKAQFAIAGAAAVAFIVIWVAINHESYALMLSSLNTLTDFTYCITQYIFFTFHAILLVFILAFAHKGADLAFGHGNVVPWGGIIQGLIWGGVKMITAVSTHGFADGMAQHWAVSLGMVAVSLCFCAVHLILGQKTRYSLPFIVVMFLFV